MVNKPTWYLIPLQQLLLQDLIRELGKEQNQTPLQHDIKNIAYQHNNLLKNNSSLEVNKDYNMDETLQ